MIVTVLLVPPLLLCAVLALGRYEEHMLAPHEERPAQRGRHLTAVPDAPDRQGPAGREGPETRARHGRRARHAA
ncbi:hypothetical protein [Streptomyces subrutilus]|uniref:hypothetical protein n=1 Tax=Streptomyces subrutilus TaxID=36818 RepID=UPI002E1025FD|nr:hypothetical protein OG479_03855 [Streptomyces subrutilus]